MDSPPPPANCQRNGCTQPSQWQVALILRAPDVSKKIFGVRVELELYICLEHGKSVKVEDFLGDKGWEEIQEVIQVAGMREADRKLTTIDLLPIIKV